MFRAGVSDTEGEVGCRHDLLDRDRPGWNHFFGGNWKHHLLQRSSLICSAEGALTRCFDLLKVDNDLISKSREMLNRGEHSGG
jgi:hypothetical protein